MKNYISLSILFIIFLSPQLLLADETQLDMKLYSAAENFGPLTARLSTIAKDLEKITNTCNCSINQFHNINYSLIHIVFINTVVIYEKEQLEVSRIVKKIFKNQYYIRKRDFLIATKENIIGRLKKMDTLASDIKDNQALLLVNEAKEVAVKSLSVIDDCISLLQIREKTL